MISLSATIRNPLVWDEVLVAGISVHVLGIFLPRITALQTLGLYGALLISLFGGRWRACLSYLFHPLLLLTLSLVGWFALTSFWSLDPRATVKSVSSVFKDYFLVLLPFLYLLADANLRRLFARAMAFCGLVIVVLNGGQYLKEFILDPSLLSNIKLHRGWGHPLVFFLPFALMQARISSGRQSILWFILFSVEALMVFATGARGAWLALIAALLVWSAHDFDRRWIAGVLSACVVVAFSAYFVLPASIVRDRVNQGMDTSFRTTGTWGPTLTMMDERPGLGFGFDKDIFNREFNRRVPEQPTWSIRQSKGPHSIYLEAGFSGGYPALAGIVALFGATLIFGVRGVLQSARFEDRLFGLAATASFAGFYITRGAFESVRWGPMILLLLIVVYFSASKQARERSGPERV